MDLEQIENLRKEMLAKIQEITDLVPGVDFTVEINFHNQNINSDLAIEAQQLNWHTSQRDDSVWFTSAQPDTGGVYIFVE